jgi:hypothetical protein
MAYTVLRYNADNDAQQDVIRDVSVLDFTDVISGAGSGSFTIPRDSPQIADLTFGTTLRFMDDDDTHVWTGVVSGTIQMGDGTVIRIPVEGLARRLADFVYPPHMILSGDASVAENSARLTQCYNWRTVTANRVTGTSSVDSDEIQSFGGDQTGTQTGVVLSNTILWDVYDVFDDDDSAGVLTIEGVDSTVDPDPAERVNNDPPYSASGTYRGPYINMAPPVGLGVSEIRMDRLRYGGAWMVDDEVKYRVTNYASTATARGTLVSSGDSTETDPEGVGADITGSSSNDYVEVQFLFTPDDVDSHGVMIQWYQVATRQVIPGISAGSFPGKDLENQMDVGGRSLLDVLDTISDTFAFEFRVRPTGEVDMQSVPLLNQWIVSSSLYDAVPDPASFTGTWTVGDTVTGGTSGATATFVASEEDIVDTIRVSTADGIPPRFVASEVLTATGGGTMTTKEATPVTIGTFWGDERQDSYHFLDETHCNIKSYTQDDSEITNFLAVTGTGNGQNAVEVVLQDDDSQNTYGVRQRIINLGLPLMADLKAEGDDYMSQRLDPRKIMVVELVDHPSLGQISLGVGDRVRVSSTRLTGFDGNPIDERLRITSKNVKVTESGNVIALTLETRPGTKTFTQSIAKSIIRADSDIGRSIGGIQMSVMETDVITTHGSSTDFTVRLPFQPVDLNANVVEVFDDVGKVWYSPSSGPNTVRVTKELLGDRHVRIGVREIGGSTNNYSARVQWSAWGDVERSGSLGR